MTVTRLVHAFLLVGMTALPGEMAHAETPDALIAKGDVFDQRMQEKEALQYIAGGQAGTEQREASRQHRPAIPPPDERHFVQRRKAPAGLHLALICKTRRGARAAERGSSAFTGDQLRKNAALHGKQRAG